MKLIKDNGLRFPHANSKQKKDMVYTNVKYVEYKESMTLILLKIE